MEWKRKKEYDYNNNLIFEGEYLKGEKGNGIIKEYYNNKLKFEGEYINGIKKGRQFDEYGNLIFEGEYLNNQEWNGKIKEIDYDNKLLFEGEYLNGLRNGIGKEYAKYDSIFYEGRLEVQYEKNC